MTGPPPDDQGWAVDDGTCDACFRDWHDRCSMPQAWPDPYEDPEAPDLLLCCCNEGYEL